MSPNITVVSFFSFFFVRKQNVCVVDTFSTELPDYWTGKRKRIQVSAKCPPFTYSLFIVRYKTGRDYRVTLRFFFGTMRLFSNFLSPKGPPSSFFDILQQTEVLKSPNGLSFQAFRLYETVSKFFFRFFKKIFGIF